MADEHIEAARLVRFKWTVTLGTVCFVAVLAACTWLMALGKHDDAVSLFTRIVLVVGGFFGGMALANRKRDNSP